MSLPPSIIRIKRKLDETPVQALYVDRSETKRQKVKKDFVFRLTRTVTSPTDPTPQPFQPQHFPRPSGSGIPKVRSTLAPASRSRPASPSVGAARTPLTSRTPSPGHGIGPLPPGSKLALDTSSVRSAKRGKSVPLSAIARGDLYGATNVGSPEALTPVAAGGEKDVSAIARSGSSDDREGPVRQGTFGSDKTHSLSSSPTRNSIKPVPSPSTASKRKATAAVRRYHLAKRLRIKHPHPYSSAATRRSAIFVREFSEPLAKDASTELDIEMEKVVEQEEPVRIRKRPQTHPGEKKRIEEEKRKHQLEKEREKKENEQEKRKTNVKFKEQPELDPLTMALQNMVFEYLNSEKNDGIQNLPASGTTVFPRGTPKGKMRDKIGGGLGGGTWKGMDKEANEELEDGEGFVYDVYIREEVSPENSKKGEDYGLIVINGSDDEEWWYEGDDDVDSDDVYGSDDEDSNAEDYHTNDYPEEPTYDSEDVDEVDAFGFLGNDSADDGDDDDSDSDAGLFKSWKNKPMKRVDDEEYDLEYDDDVDVEAEGMRRKMAGIWGYREGGRVLGLRKVDSGDEMED